jgi:hypothetical protein
MSEKKSRNTNLIRLLEQSLELVQVSVFKKQAEILYLLFSLTRQVKYLKKHLRMYKKYCFNFLPSKKYSSGDSIPFKVENNL